MKFYVAFAPVSAVCLLSRKFFLSVYSMVEMKLSYERALSAQEHTRLSSEYPELKEHNPNTTERCLPWSSIFESLLL